MMKAENAAKWAATRERGQWHFILHTGVLRWGLVMCAVFIGMQGARHPHHLLFVVALNVPVWIGAGLLFGVLSWHVTEWQYRHHMAKILEP